MTKFKIYTDVKTLVKKGNVEIGEIGYIIDILDYPCEGYVVEFSKKGEYKPWALEIYDPSELEEIKNIK